MNESRVSRDNYITISGWMITELGLKGNELIIYALIYGFSQAENQAFDGSMNYIAEWLSTSRQTVNNALKSLVDKGLISKDEIILNNAKYCKYRATRGAATAPKAPAAADEEAGAEIFKDIIDYLNLKTGRKFDPKNRESRKHIRARLAEGRQLEDFKRVIDVKCAEWLGGDMEKFLRPSTLFGSKFESYVNQQPARNATARASDNPAQSFDINDIF